MSLDFLNLPEGVELVPEDERTIDVTILRENESAKGEPAFVVTVKRLTVEDFRKINRAVAAKMQGTRPGPKQAERASAEFSQRYVRKVFVNWRGLTIRNFNALVSSDVRIGGPRAKELIEQKWEVPFSYEAAAGLLQSTWSEDFDQPIYAAVKRGAEEVAEEEAGKGSA